MKKINKLFAVAALLTGLLGGFTGCSDISSIEDSSFPVSTGSARLVLEESAGASYDITNIVFKGKKEGASSKTTFGQWTTKASAASETVKIPAGNWKFYLTAEYNGPLTSEPVECAIVAGKTSKLKFHLVRPSSSTSQGAAFSANWYFADYVNDFSYTDNKYTLDSGKTQTVGSVTVTGKATLSNSASTSDNAEKTSGYVQLGNGGSSASKNIKINIPAGTTKITIWAKCGTADTEANASKTSAILTTSGAVSSSKEYAKGSSWSATEIVVENLTSAKDLYIFNGGDSTAGSLNISAILYSGKTIVDDEDDEGSGENGGGVSGNQNGEGLTNVVEAGTPGTVETSGSVVFTTQGSWAESLYATWADVSGASSYEVSYSEDNSTWTKVDSELVRSGWTVREVENYGLSYTDKNYSLNRVDIVGIKPNTKYYVKVTPNVGNASIFSATTGSYYRGGYAFFNRKTTGAYKEDGTLADNAVVVYVTDANKNSVTGTVNGSLFTGIVDMMGVLAETAKEKAHGTTPVSIRFLGTVTMPTASGSSSKASSIMNTSLTYMLSKYNDNVTFEGVGPGAMLYGWGLTVKVGNNIEVRNLAFNMQKEDALSFEDTVLGGWVHNNDFYIGANGGGDKKKGDGASDIKADSNWFTFSYNHYVSTGKSSLCGMSGDSAPETVYITYCNNWFDKCGSRTPRIRRYNVHIYNNYFDHNYSAGVAACIGASAFVQNNYFEDVNQPVIAAGQGHSVKTDGSDFCSGEDGGVVKMYGNIMAECGEDNEYMDGELTIKTIHYKCTDRFTGGRELTDAMKTASSKGFYPDAPDAFIANSRNETVPASFYALNGGATYRNFDTDSSKCYSDSEAGILAASVVKENCKQNAGAFTSK